MTFSIVIPTYNGADFVAQAIDSVLNQIRPADEVIVSDDNSSDGTLEICRKYGDRIRIFRNPHGPSGFVNGWNNAIANATSDYISILHQDDLLSPLFLQEIEKALKQHPSCRHLFTSCDYIDANGDVLESQSLCDGTTKIYTGAQYVKAYRTQHIHRCPGVVTHRDIFKVCKYRAEAGHIADNDFFFRVGQWTEIAGILKPLASYRQHEKSETGHIGDLELSKRLLHDYDFQIKHFKENSLFDKDDHRYFLYWKYRYFRRVIGYGLKRKNFKDIKYAFEYL